MKSTLTRWEFFAGSAIAGILPSIWNEISIPAVAENAARIADALEAEAKKREEWKEVPREMTATEVCASIGEGRDNGALRP
jgi:hypothetical protein